MADFQNRRFSKLPILKIFLWKFHGLVLGLVGLIDAKNIDVAQPIWSWVCPTLGQKQPKNTKYAFFACFCPYVGQPHGHVGWAKSMPFSSINPTNPWTNPWNFHKKIWELAILKNGDFENRPFWIFFFRKKKFLLHPNKNQSQIMWWNGWDSILMLSLVSTKFLAMRNISLYNVIFQRSQDLNLSFSMSKNFDWNTKNIMLYVLM